MRRRIGINGTPINSVVFLSTWTVADGYTLCTRTWSIEFHYKGTWHRKAGQWGVPYYAEVGEIGVSHYKGLKKLHSEISGTIAPRVLCQWYPVSFNSKLRAMKVSRGFAAMNAAVSPDSDSRLRALPVEGHRFPNRRTAAMLSSAPSYPATTRPRHKDAISSYHEVLLCRLCSVKNLFQNGRCTKTDSQRPGTLTCMPANDFLTLPKSRWRNQVEPKAIIILCRAWGQP